MGRIFEVRKHTMFARWDRMAKQFARIAKDINIAVKAGGGDVNSNPALRRQVQNARHVNMPKDKVDAAIKRALGNDSASYEQIIYEGYAPHGVAVIVEAATDNATRTVAQVRTILSKGGGNLGTAGSVAFQFRKMGVFRLKPDGIDQDGDAVRCITLVKDLLEIRGVLAGGALDRRVDLVLRHVDRARVLDNSPQRRIAVRVGTAGLHGDRDVLADARDLLRHPVPPGEHRVLADFEDASHCG